MSHLLNLSLILGLVMGVSAPSLAANRPQRPPALRPEPMPKVDCSNIAEQLGRLKTMSGEHNQSVAAFMDDVIVVMDKWHQEFEPFEGKSVSLPKGQFQSIKETAGEVSEVQSKVWEDLGIVDQRFDELLEVLPSCLK